MRRNEKWIEYGPIIPAKDAHRYERVRWVENVSCGLRRVGFADEILPRSINHKGWYLDDDGDFGVYRGIVFALPSQGEPRYVYGYDDPNNDDCALLCFDSVADKDEAARKADRFAELFAEAERDYRRVWDAGRRYDDLGDEIKELRREALALGRELRSVSVEKTAPLTWAAGREKFVSLYKQIKQARKERKELFDTYGRQPGFEE